jgi:hypothetical protein
MTRHDWQQMVAGLVIIAFASGIVPKPGVFRKRKSKEVTDGRP